MRSPSLTCVLENSEHFWSFWLKSQGLFHFIKEKTLSLSISAHGTAYIVKTSHIMPQVAVTSDANSAHGMSSLLSMDGESVPENLQLCHRVLHKRTQATKSKGRTTSSCKVVPKQGTTATNTGKTTAKTIVPQTWMVELKDLQRQSLASINDMISTMKSQWQLWLNPNRLVRRKESIRATRSPLWYFRLMGKWKSF